MQILLPYEFSPTVALVCAVSLGVYVTGLFRVRCPTSLFRAAAFLIGLALIYASLQTRFDYWSQHLFFVHRIQHLVLHHLGPFLIALAAPGSVLYAGLPARVRTHVVDPIAGNRLARGGYAAVQQPVVAAILFVGLIYLWLYPPVHFYSMLNVPLYNAMNWTMALDGLLFWKLMLDRRPPKPGRTLRYGVRIGMLVAVIFPQIAIGAYIALVHHDLYPVYAVCGRLWPISPMTDQTLGGLITWIPPAMMSVLGVLVVLTFWQKAENPSGRPAEVVSNPEETMRSPRDYAG